MYIKKYFFFQNKLSAFFQKKGVHNEFTTAIDSLKRKSKGYDGISEMKKDSPELVRDLINRFMNLCLENLLFQIPEQ